MSIKRQFLVGLLLSVSVLMAMCGSGVAYGQGTYAVPLGTGGIPGGPGAPPIVPPPGMSLGDAASRVSYNACMDCLNDFPGPGNCETCEEANNDGNAGGGGPGDRGGPCLGGCPTGGGQASGPISFSKSISPSTGFSGMPSTKPKRSQPGFPRGIVTRTASIIENQSFNYTYHATDFGNRKRNPWSTVTLSRIYRSRDIASTGSLG